MAPSTTISIVLADDDHALRGMLRDRLRGVGWIVREAADGHVAVGLVQEHRPDVLVLDLRMPKLDGLGVLEALRFDPAAGRLAVVVLSGLGEADGQFEALGGGAVATLSKDVPLDDLVDAITTWAERAVGPPFGIDPDAEEAFDAIAGAVPDQNPPATPPR